LREQVGDGATAEQKRRFGLDDHGSPASSLKAVLADATRRQWTAEGASEEDGE
jgi:hypothetical protein